ncbi:SDR family NAD(P)-dependent oxidoreductase [Roseisalinus antarcticus]|uniref:3-oxoacyl-[acyl-carrier-protein] reductase FabG n=1 Tax=Roseisalinus antarcticus TaxID=254357 RepID=A0A1Y5SRW4_9RHOB|nr:SDR family NAD(P)-dependent oxidoreductase [Roseisalinus antarcticus]SLN46586.1 3-oxoacyl-[acyl-carrier-protein] reductase FabG [Roseisalinus antarcticus]
MRVLVTGANRGIGAALLAAFEARGDTVRGTARRPGGGDLLPLDVTDPASVAALPGQVGALDLLVCNAGIFPDRGEALDTGFPAAMWADTFATNVTGVFLTVQALLPALKASRGRIAIISSQMGSSAQATGGAYIYRASKAAALNLGRNLATDLAVDGIAVGIYHPGWVRTEMGGSAADISVTEAAGGLLDRFDSLSPATSGTFETWDGRPHPF